MHSHLVRYTIGSNYNLSSTGSAATFVGEPRRCALQRTTTRPALFLLTEEHSSSRRCTNVRGRSHNSGMYDMIHTRARIGPSKPVGLFLAQRQKNRTPADRGGTRTIPASHRWIRGVPRRIHLFAAGEVSAGSPLNRCDGWTDFETAAGLNHQAVSSFGGKPSHLLPTVGGVTSDDFQGWLCPAGQRQ